jgi:predicted transposase/invertase (TIGR01784 family)
VDVVFQILFGSEKNKDLLISLLNSIVGPGIHVVDVSIKNPFNLASYRRGKRSILDIKAVDQNGIWYDIEMQCTEHVFYGKRAIFYVSKVYTDQLEAGTSYSGLNTTIGIHFLDFNYFDDDRMVHHFVFKEMETNEHPEQLSFLQLYFVELGKFRKDWPQICTALDRWVALLTKAKLLDRSALPDALQGEPAIVKALAELERIGADPKQRALYEAEVKARMVDTIQLQTAEERGEQRGEKRGMQQGMQQGMFHGRQEGRKQLLLRQMTRHIGEVPSNVLALVDKLTADELDDLGEAMFDLNTYAEVEAWFSRQ